MKLRTFIEQKARNNNLIKVGCKNGVSFFYCDKIRKVQTTQEIAEISRNYLVYLRKQLIAKRNRLEQLDIIYKGKLDYCDKYKNEKKRQKMIEKTYKSWQNEKAILPKQIKTLEKETDNFVSLLDRQIVEVVDGISPDEPNCFVVYIVGTFRGKYWTVMEYQDRNLPKGMKRRLRDVLDTTSSRED